jgi:DNA-binding XRE family transcriptional regulator
MADANDSWDGLKPPPAFLEALARAEERLRQDPNWDPRTDLIYRGPHPAFPQGQSRPIGPQAVRQEEPTPRPRAPVRAALPFGQRIRELRQALGWTQREVATQLGVSPRTVIRYELGQSGPIQSAPLMALRRLESAHAQELHAQVGTHARVCS